MAKGMLLKTDGSIEDIRSNGLDDLQAFVGGDIEIATSDEDWTLWMNDEGRLNYSPDEDNEFKNNEIARRFVAEVSGTPLGGIFSLHGNAVLIGTDMETGEDNDLPEEIGNIAKKHEGSTNPYFFDEPFANVWVG
jgi:hypothetical protein